MAQWRQGCRSDLVSVSSWAARAELCSLRWAQIDLKHGRLHVNRAKGGIESVHPLHGPELRALRPLLGKSPHVFVTEAGSSVTTAWFLRMLQRTGKAAKLPSLCIPTWSGIRPDMSLQMMVTIPDRWRITLDIAICNRLRATLRQRKIGSRGFGRISACIDCVDN